MLASCFFSNSETLDTIFLFVARKRVIVRMISYLRLPLLMIGITRVEDRNARVWNVPFYLNRRVLHALPGEPLLGAREVALGARLRRVVAHRDEDVADAHAARVVLEQHLDLGDGVL
jgi:hypothetical protein